MFLAKESGRTVHGRHVWFHGSPLITAIWGKQIGLFHLSVKARIALLCHLPLWVGCTVRPMAGSRPPSAGGHLASWFHLTGNLLSSQSVIPQSHYRRRKKTLIQSLSLYLKKTDFQPHHRRCLFKKHRRWFGGCASFITHICCCFSSLALSISN